MKKNPPHNWRRPHTLCEVVGSAGTTEEIGLNLAEFLDHVNLLVRKKTGPRALLAGIRVEPPRTGDAVQDSYLAAVAAHLARKHRLPIPRWTEKKSRRLDRPWFAAFFAQTKLAWEFQLQVMPAGEIHRAVADFESDVALAVVE